MLPDVVFSLEAGENGELAEMIQAEGLGDLRKPAVVFSVSDTVSAYGLSGYPRECRYQEYVRAMAEAADYCVERYGAEVVFIGHVQGRNSDDRQTAREVQALMHYSHRARCLAGEYSHEAYRSFLGEYASLSVMARMHAAIASFSMGVPVVPVGYSRKTEGIFGGMLGLGELVVDIRKCEDREVFLRQLKEKMDLCWGDREKRSGEMTKRYRAIKEQTREYVTILREVMGNGPENKSSSGMKGEEEWMAVLECPACHTSDLGKGEGAIVCRGCGRRYPIRQGIPDLSWFPEDADDRSVFNREQARYERALHDGCAETSYDEEVVRIYGDKTELIGEGWAGSFPGPYLDFGCGTGQISRTLKRRGGTVFACDISPASVLRNVRENGVVGIGANAFCLPYRDRSISTVCCNGVLHHIVDLKTAIKEMARVAGRYIAISEGCTTEYQSGRRVINRLLRGTEKLLLRHPRICRWIGRTGTRDGISSPPTDSKYERPLDPREVIDLLEQNGFRCTRLRFWTNINWRCRSRLKKILIRALVSRKWGSHFEIRTERVLNIPVAGHRH